MATRQQLTGVGLLEFGLGGEVRHVERLLDVVKGYLVMARKESKTLMGIATEYGLSSKGRGRRRE